MGTLLVIGKTWPESKSTGAGWRMLQLLDLFNSYGYSITFGSASAKTEFSDDLTALNISETDISLNDATFNELLKELKPDVVLFDRFMTEEQFGWRVADVCPDALRLLDTEDLHCLRIARETAYKVERKFKKEDVLNDTAKREIASILRCDLSIIISEAEKLLLKNIFNVDENLLFYLPFLTNPFTEDILNKLPSFEERQHFLMIGNWLHKPNADAVRFVKKEVWPLIKAELPDAKIYCYGAYQTDKFKQMHTPKDGFYISGRADSADVVFRNSKVLLSPLPYGAGLKTKFINAMQNGTPSVTNMVGAEGIAGALPYAGEIANTPKDIAKQAVQLYISKPKWQTAQKKGIEIINERFQRSGFEMLFEEKLKELSLNLKKYRQNNFIGQILQHHTLQSTKYLSKWIEEKNSHK